MVKKNGITNWVTKNLFAISAIVVAIANLWLITKLAPLSQDIAIIRNKVLANEQDITDLDTDTDSQRKEILSEFKYLRDKVDEIYMLIK